MTSSRRRRLTRHELPDRTHLMTTETFPDIVCDVDVPRDGGHFGVPTAWIDDDAVSFSAKGILVYVVGHPRGAVVTDSRGLGPDEPSVGEVVAELVEAGYLLPETVDGVERLRLVHPARLGPLPSA